MPIVVKLSGDLTDLEAKFKAAGIKVEEFGDKTDATSKQTSDAMSRIDASMANLEQSAQRTAEAMEKMEGGRNAADSLADGFGNTERVLLGVNDNLGVMAEQFGINIGPAQEYAQAAADVAGGMEGIIGGGQALIKQLVTLPAGMAPVVASTWAHVTALYAQAAAFIAANLPMIAIIATIALVAAGIVLLVQHWDTVVEKIPALGTAVETVKSGLDAFVLWISTTFIPAVASLYDPAIKGPLDLIVGYFQMQFDLIKVVVETALGVIKGVVDIFMGVFTGDWDRAWGGVKQVIDSLWSGIKEAFNIGVSFFTDDVVPRLLSAGGAMGEALMGGLKSALSNTLGFAGDVASAVLGAVKGLINSYVIDPLNGALEFSWDTGIPGLGSVGINPPDIPRLAKGGIVTQPTLALIGEAGPEAVVPLRDLNSLTIPGVSGSGGNYTVPIGGLAGGGGGPFGYSFADHIEFALGGKSGWTGNEIPQNAGTMYGLYAAGVISEGQMYQWLLDNGYTPQDWDDSPGGGYSVTVPGTSTGGGYSIPIGGVSGGGGGGGATNYRGAQGEAAMVFQMYHLWMQLSPEARRLRAQDTSQKEWIRLFIAYGLIDAILEGVEPGMTPEPAYSPGTGMTPAPAYTPGFEPGYGPDGKPTGGGSGARNGGSPGAVGGGGGGAGGKIDASTQVLMDIEQRLANFAVASENADREQGQLLRELLGALSHPLLNVVVNGATPANLRELANMLVDYMADALKQRGDRLWSP